MDPFKNAKFKGLHKAWMKKLKTSGFKDIEDLNSQQEWLKTWDSLYFMARSGNETIQTTQEYFSVAEHLLRTHEFESEDEKKVWQHHSDGLAVREIESLVYTKKNRLNKDKINAIIQRLQKFIGRR